MIWLPSKRKKLVSEGLASRKTWRTLPETSLVDVLEKSPLFRALVGLIFVLLLVILAYWGSETTQAANFSAILTAFTGLLGIAAATILFKDLKEKHSRFILFFSAIFWNLLVIKLCLLYWPAQPNAAIGDRPEAFALPAALAPMLVTILLGYGPGMLCVAVNSLLAAPLAPVSDAQVYQAIVLSSLLSGLAAVFFSRQIRKRNHILRAGFFTGLVSVVNVLVFAPLYSLGWDVVLWQGFLVVLLGVLTSFIVNAVLPIFEAVFDITTDISWLEQADLNHPLIRRLSIEAPGTYHHSLVMANLAETAAMAIGANALQCRVSAYFHDIGKLVKPAYFVENQGDLPNPHEDLNPSMSTIVITSHVKEGVDLAIKYKLNRHIIDAIREHHGTTVVKYFHNKALRQHEDAVSGVRILKLREDDLPESPSEQSFRYDGPRPRSRETAILMLADGAEAIARCLIKPTPAKIEEAVDNLLHDRIEDGQFDECPISLKELRQVAKSLTTTIISMMHNRISYPDDEKSKSRGSPAEKTASPSPESQEKKEPPASHSADHNSQPSAPPQDPPAAYSQTDKISSRRRAARI